MENTMSEINFIGSEQIKYEPSMGPEPSKASEKKFRISAKRLFLTYSRTNLSPSEVLFQLEQKFQHLEKYVISQEEHVDEPEKGKHIHAYLEFSRKANILYASFLDLEESKKKVHGEYQAVKNKHHVIAYVKKEGAYIANFETETEFKLKLFLLAKERGLSEAMDYFVKSKPELVSTHFKKISSNLKAFLENIDEKLSPKFTNYNYPEDLLHWFNFERDEKTLFLTGPSGTGKTEGLINLLKDFNPILITDINALKDLKSSNKAIIFDDIDWLSIPRETKIHLFDKNRCSNIKIIYQTVKLVPDLVKAVISNNSEDLISVWDDDKAISRRISHVKINGPIFNKINQQIIINFFNSKTMEENTNGL
jgi:hypothetical protein